MLLKKEFQPIIYSKLNTYNIQSIKSVCIFLVTMQQVQDSGYNNSRKDQSKLTWILSIYLHPLVDLIFRLSLLIENLDNFSAWSAITVTENVTFDPNLLHSIANSSLFPTSLYLHSNSTQILALKKNLFFWKKKSSPQKIIFFTFFLCNFSVRTLWCFQKN